MGMSGEEALGAARKYVKDTMKGQGAIKGDKGDPGTDGLSIVGVKITQTGTLECTLSDGSVITSTGTLDDVLSEDFTPNVAQGKIVAGETITKGTSLENIIMNMLTQYVKPSVEITLNPSTTIYDVVTESLASVTLSAKVTKGTSKVKKVEFYAGGTVVNTVTTGVEEGGTFSYKYTPDTPIKKDTVFKAVVTDVEDGSASVSKTVVFIGKSYYGTVGEEVITPTEADIKGLQNTTLKNSKKFVYQHIKVDYGKVLYAYPASLGKVTKIVDADGRDYTNSYTQSEVTVDGIKYYAYLLTDAMGTDDGYQSFI